MLASCWLWWEQPGGNWSAWNIAIFSGLLVIVLARIRWEERLLSGYTSLRPPGTLAAAAGNMVNRSRDCISWII